MSKENVGGGTDAALLLLFIKLLFAAEIENAIENSKMITSVGAINFLRIFFIHPFKKVVFASFVLELWFSFFSLIVFVQCG
jgi:hypothetical protein